MENDAKKVIAGLVDLQKGHLENQEAKVYVGFEGWKTLYNEILNNLKPGDEYLAFGIGPEEFADEKIQIFFKNFHLRRAEKKVVAKIIMKPETKKLDG
ncbi:hypothetical protein J4447_00435 [Candidatus Pacearchaeota archaeon]|nr:hypothetical protein [Candidatus Pacearchaeota archaeon]